MGKINLILGAAVILVIGYLLGAVAVPLSGKSTENTADKTEVDLWKKDPVIKVDWSKKPSPEEISTTERIQQANDNSFESSKSPVSTTSNAGRNLAAKTSEMYRNRRRQKHQHQVAVRAAQAEQQHEAQRYYQSVILPQQQAAAQQSFENSMQAVDRMNQQEMLNIQRERNYLLQQKIWNDQTNFWMQQSQPRGHR
ncbi:hypothetical protein [Gimesia sp.]|uniref:hypothetical protein n=1 Tax=Gimesia sp. TaxID=2024833 RepID=UPI003A93D181